MMRNDTAIEALLRTIVSSYDCLGMRNELPDAIAKARRYLKELDSRPKIVTGDYPAFHTGTVRSSEQVPVWQRDTVQ